MFYSNNNDDGLIEVHILTPVNFYYYCHLHMFVIITDSLELIKCKRVIIRQRKQIRTYEYSNKNS